MRILPSTLGLALFLVYGFHNTEKAWVWIVTPFVMLPLLLITMMIYEKYYKKTLTGE